MSLLKKDGLDELLKAYSVTSEREDGWLSRAIMKNAEADDVRFDPERVKAFMGRFSDEKPFGNLVFQAISQMNATSGDLSRELGISEEIIEKVLTNTALPNIVPLRKMIALLRYLKLPLARATEGMRVSLGRLRMDDSLIWASSPAMRRGKYRPPNSVGRAEKKSMGVLRRDIEAYIKRLTEEGL